MAIPILFEQIRKHIELNEDEIITIYKFLNPVKLKKKEYLFSASFPEFMQRVPQYMIASYLGLTPEYLSELRKKK